MDGVEPVTCQPWTSRLSKMAQPSLDYTGKQYTCNMQSNKLIQASMRKKQIKTGIINTFRYKLKIYINEKECVSVTFRLHCELFYVTLSELVENFINTKA